MCVYFFASFCRNKNKKKERGKSIKWSIISHVLAIFFSTLYSEDKWWGRIPKFGPKMKLIVEPYWPLFVDLIWKRNCVLYNLLFISPTSLSLIPMTFIIRAYSIIAPSITIKTLSIRIECNYVACWYTECGILLLCSVSFSECSDDYSHNAECYNDPHYRCCKESRCAKCRFAMD